MDDIWKPKLVDIGVPTDAYGNLIKLIDARIALALQKPAGQIPNFLSEDVPQFDDPSCQSQYATPTNAPR